MTFMWKGNDSRVSLALELNLCCCGIYLVGSFVYVLVVVVVVVLALSWCYGWNTDSLSPQADTFH